MTKLTKSATKKRLKESQKKMEKVYLFFLANNNGRHKDAAEVIRKMGIMLNTLK